MTNSGKEKPISKEVKELKNQHILEESDTKRERKSPARFSIAVPTPVSRELVIPKGDGTPLGSISQSLLLSSCTLPPCLHHAKTPSAVASLLAWCAPFYVWTSFSLFLCFGCFPW